MNNRTREGAQVVDTTLVLSRKGIKRDDNIKKKGNKCLVHHHSPVCASNRFPTNSVFCF